MSCKACQAAVDSAIRLRLEGLLPEEYADDPEGASMYAYDQGWLCGGHFCLNEVDEEDLEPIDQIVGPPKWVIALWLEEKNSDLFLPIAFSWDYWPVGGSYTEIAEQLGWYPETMHSLRVGGIYGPLEGPLVWLVCWDAVHGDLDFFSSLPNATVLLGAAEIDLEKWGMA